MANFRVIVGPHVEPVIVRRIGAADLKDALARGLDDFLAKPSHLLFLGTIYPLVCIGLYKIIATDNALPLLYPLASGLALIGPFVALGLYEISRRRESGEQASWRYAFAALRSPSIPSILELSLVLMLMFLLWLRTAQALYEWLFGPLAPTSYLHFIHEVFTTSHGWTLVVLGNAIGLVFAIAALSISVISFPLLLDREVGTAVAVQTSIRAVLTNPVTMTLWGMIVVALLVIGSLPVFVGLAVVMPILGHSTWHLYRKVVEPAASEKRFGA